MATQTFYPNIFSVEGNIGSGKSTIVEFMKNNTKLDNIVFLREPVDLWENIKDKNGESILSKFYANTKKYSFSFQMMAYISRLALLRDTVRKHPNKIIVTERCVSTDKNVFAQMLYDDGNIEEVDYKIYLQWFEEFIHDFPITAYIYVYTPPEVCSERIRKRNRNGENIPDVYLQRCDFYHNNWLNDVVPDKILRLDGTVQANGEEYIKNIDEIFKFIQRQ